MPTKIVSTPTSRAVPICSCKITRPPMVEQRSMQLGVITPMWPAGANARPPAVSSTYGAPAPHASNSACGTCSLPKPRRTKIGKRTAPATPKRSAVTSHAVNVLLAIASFVIAGKPAHINAASAP
jgi:hypothetical protein